MMFVNPTWFCSAIVPSEFPLGLEHLDSDLCWCDPIIDTDSDGLDHTASLRDVELTLPSKTHVENHDSN